MSAEDSGRGGSGILLVDKPGGITSHDVVARARRALGTRKVGHAGTLDPMATGLLILGVDSSTRLLTHLVGLGKQYTATIRLGQGSTTDDADGELSGIRDAAGLTPAKIESGVVPLRGEIAQVPSTFSAIKVDGRRSYDRARSGEEFELAPRTVTVSRFDVLDQRQVQSGDGTLVDVDAVIDCSSGTYIRALARDLGAALGVGGHLTALRRTEVGPFSVGEAVAVDAIGPEAVRPAAEVAARLFPIVRLSQEQLLHLTQGKRVELDASDAPIVAALSPSGSLAGLVSLHGGVARVLVNFPTAEVLA